MNNRPLKFRAWDIKNKKFLNPCDIAINGNGNILVTDSGWYENFENQNSSDYIVQQFTGEHDKNNLPIYEGDIIRTYCDKYLNGILVSGNFEAEVVFLDAEFQRKLGEKQYAALWGGYTTEVIGNVLEAENKEDVFCLDIDSAMKHCPMPEGTKKYTFEILYPNKDGSFGSWGTDAKDIQHGFGISFEDMITTSHKSLVTEDMSRVKFIKESPTTPLEYAEHIVAVDKCRLGYKDLHSKK